MQDVFEKIIEKLNSKKTYFQGFYECEGKTEHDSDLNKATQLALDDAIEIVKQEDTEYNNGWIPCSERLPNQDGEFTDVLITCESISDGVFVQSAEFYIATDGEPIFDALYHYERVLAWKPIPAPYQSKGDNDEKN